MFSAGLLMSPNMPALQLLCYRSICLTRRFSGRPRSGPPDATGC
jgi:hypothetical protein